jgi:predicted enzyme related to lactoylglutathione lyase
VIYDAPMPAEEPPVCTSVAPIFPVSDVARALAHYEKLGFSVSPYTDAGGGPPAYGFMALGKAEIHLALVPDVDPLTNTSACYLYVDDADQLFTSWQLAGVLGRLQPPTNTPYRLREFAHVDPDGNLIRVGSQLASP